MSYCISPLQKAIAASAPFKIVDREDAEENDNFDYEFSLGEEGKVRMMMIIKRVCIYIYRYKKREEHKNVIEER